MYIAHFYGVSMHESWEISQPQQPALTSCLSPQDGELTHDEVLQSYVRFMSDHYVDDDDDDDDVVDEGHDELWQVSLVMTLIHTSAQQADTADYLSACMHLLSDPFVGSCSLNST